VDADPRYADAYFAVGTILAERGQLAEAIQALEQAVATAGPAQIEGYRRRLDDLRRRAGHR
jgi:tetratricopeptide (TPR) repeat protein